MLHFQVCSLLLLKLPMPHQPAPPLPSLPMKQITHSHTIACTASTLTAPDFLQQREGEKRRTSCSQSSLLVLCSDFVPDIVWFYMQVTQSFFSHGHQVLLENVAIIHQVLKLQSASRGRVIDALVLSHHCPKCQGKKP